MDGVVGEAGEGVDSFVKLDFGFVGAGDLAETQNGINTFFQVTFRRQVRFDFAGF